MKIYLMRLLFAISFALSLIIWTNASHAFDEQNMLRKFQTFAQENNIIFTFASVEKPDDKTLIINNADYYDEKTKKRQQVETLTLHNVRESNAGNLQYDSLEASNIVQKGKASRGEVTISIESFFSDGLEFSDGTGNSQKIWPDRIALGEIKNLTIETNGGRGKTKILFPSATIEGTEQVSLRNFKFKNIKLSQATGTIKSGKDTIALSLGAITVEDMVQFGAQGFGISLIDIGAFEMNIKSKTGEKVELVFEGMSVENFFSSDLSIEDSSFISDKSLSVEIKPLSATIDGAEFTGWSRGFATTKNDQSTNTVVSDAALEGMYIDFAHMPQTPQNAQILKTLEELDLMKMVLNIKGTGSWERKTGFLEISKYNIELEDGAAFEMSARISGYTEDIARQFTKAINTMNAETDKQKKNALAFQAMAYLANLSIQRMEIVLDDQSLLNRVINVQAAKFKQDPEQIKGIVGPMTTIMLAPYNIPELAAQASQALGTFMQGNKKLIITAEPVNGLAVTEIIALSSGVQAGSVTSADLAKRLNLTVVAE